MNIQFSVFTKPWKIPIPELAKKVKKLGFDGIELPVRPGFQVEPERIEIDLPGAVKEFDEHGLKIHSIAGPYDEKAIAVCGENRIPIIRTMIRIPSGTAYLEQVEQVRREYEAVVPALDRYGVTIGVQNHCGRFLANAMQLRQFVKHFDPKHVGIVWDAAHCAFDGEETAIAAELVWEYLCLVNLKNGIYRRVNGPEADCARYERYWTSGRQGLTSWQEVVQELKNRKYTGWVCLPAEYSDDTVVDRVIVEDISFVRSLFNQEG